VGLSDQPPFISIVYSFSSDPEGVLKKLTKCFCLRFLGQKRPGEVIRGVTIDWHIDFLYGTVENFPYSDQAFLTIIPRVGNNVMKLLSLLLYGPTESQVICGINNVVMSKK
jgi:hypothetical protein